MLYLTGYSDPPKQLSLAQLNVRNDWKLMHPEFRKRLVAMMDASDGKLGFGGGWRSSVQQRLLFLSRYVKSAVPTGIYWEGSYWALRPGMAPSAPPDLSYHESTIEGFGVAADMIGDLKFMHDHGAEFGLRDFRNVGNEPWHCQPAELPTSRRTYNATPPSYPLKVWSPPAPPPVETPAPPAGPPEGDHRMLVVVGLEENHSDPRRWAWSGVSLRLLRSEAEFDQLRLIFPFHPNWSSLAAPYWMTQAEIDSYA